MTAAVAAHRTAADLRDAYASGELTPVEVLDATLGKVADVDTQLNAIAYLNADQAREQARASAARWADGSPLGVLDGIPISIKDSVSAKSTPWRHGSAGHRHLADSDFDSPPAARLKQAGAVIFAKTTMPDFGMLASGVSSLYGIVRNPWNLAMSPGGSSAGAAASLAAGIGSMSVGSDIAGSVRLPAAHCGLVALKPTQGRIPHLAPSMVRSAGPMARTVREAAELFSVLSQPDSRDHLSLPGGPIELGAAELGDAAVTGLRVGVMLDMGYGFAVLDEVRTVVLDAAHRLTDAGAQVSEIPPVFTTNPFGALDRLFAVRARTEWAALDAEHRRDVLDDIVQWSSAADGISAAQHETDLSEVAASAAHVTATLAPFDVVLSPVLPGLGHRAEMIGLNPAAPVEHCSFTCWFNQTGQPASTVGFGMSHGMPIGVQIAGPRFSDARVLAVTEWLEARRPVTYTWPERPLDLPPLPSECFAAGHSDGE